MEKVQGMAMIRWRMEPYVPLRFTGAKLMGSGRKEFKIKRLLYDATEAITAVAASARAVYQERGLSSIAGGAQGL
jgi:hypothetical protein